MDTNRAQEIADKLFSGKYANKIHEQFRKEVEAAGFEVRHYKGRFFYDGPAVAVDNDDQYHDLVRATNVRLQCDNLGMGKIVYPK